MVSITFSFSFDDAFARREFTAPRLFAKTKKPAQKNSVAGFTIRSPTPVVTTLGCRFIASTIAEKSRVFFSQLVPFVARFIRGLCSLEQAPVPRGQKFRRTASYGRPASLVVKWQRCLFSPRQAALPNMTVDLSELAHPQ
jgi:hypothetical protein